MRVTRRTAGQVTSRPGSGGSGRGRSVRAARVRGGLVLGGLVLALLTAGCGSDDGGDGIATAGGPTVDASASARPASDPEDAQEQQLRFAQCMREHGVDMPDPEVNDSGGTSITIPDGADPQQVDAATEACKQHLPNGGEPQPVDEETQERTREFAKCMRENGVPNFPDPDENGGIQINPDELGVGPGDPAMEAAEEACKQYMGPEDGSGEDPRLDSRTS